MKNKCPKCLTGNPIKGQAADGRRAYRCVQCTHVWTQEKKKTEHNKGARK